MNINPRGVLRPARNGPGYEFHTDKRRRTPLQVMAYTVYPHYSNTSLRYAANSLRSVIVRNYTTI